MTDFRLSQLAVWVDWLPSADTFYIDRKTRSAAQGKLDERLKDSSLTLTMIEWCRSGEGWWLPFLDVYRTMCLATPLQFRRVLEELRERLNA